MCYFISLQVIPQDKANKVKKKISFASFKGVKIFGKFPDYEISQGMCACGLVKDKGKRVLTISEVVKHLLNQPEIKRVKVIWYWGDRLPRNAPEEKLSLDEFMDYNEQSNLGESIWFNLSHSTQ